MWGRGNNVSKPGKWNFLYRYCSPSCEYLAVERQKQQEIEVKEKKKLDKEMGRLQKKIEKREKEKKTAKRASSTDRDSFLSFAGDRKKP